MPLKGYHFNLTKREFRDNIALRYGWDTVKSLSLCTCNENFTVTRDLNYPKRGYNKMRHNELCDSFANLLNDVLKAVAKSISTMNQFKRTKNEQKKFN